MTIQEAIKEAHECAKLHGFHNPLLSIPAMLALINMELSKAVEADRKDIYCHVKIELWIDDIANDEVCRDTGISCNFKQFYESEFKNTFECELANACIGIFDLAGLLELEIYNSIIFLKESDLPGNIMEAINMLGCAYCVKDDMPALTHFISKAIGIIFAIAEKLNLDIWKYIEVNMKYNRLRSVNNGKKY